MVIIVQILDFQIGMFACTSSTNYLENLFCARMCVTMPVFFSSILSLYTTFEDADSLIYKINSSNLETLDLNLLMKNTLAEVRDLAVCRALFSLRNMSALRFHMLASQP